ncbi:MAG TPA: biotin/lipoyl-containing protein [Candidatus Limnocylindrales bacterium]|nr:biotin/lipoyl-containing protein [Candidatus Limnocylindrales bacterium]
MPDQEARQVIARLTDEMVPRLIERLSKSDLAELEVREDGWRIRVRRAVGAVDGAADVQPRAAAKSHARTTAVPVMSDQQAQKREQRAGTVQSPAVGYFTPRNGVEGGATVRRGDPLGHVDVLGVRQEVVAPIDGVLKGFDVESGQAVEFGEPLARVEAGVQ